MSDSKKNRLDQKALQSPTVQALFPAAYHSQLQLVQYPAGATICQQGDRLPFLAVFLRGKIKIVRRLFNGKEHILGIFDRETILGDIELMTGKTAVSSVVALEESWLIQLPLQTSHSLLEDPVFLYNIGRSLAQTLYQQNIQAATNIGYSVKERLATHILSIEKQGHFQLELATLADSFGTSYRHLLRVLKDLTLEGILTKSGRHYEIRRRKALEDLAIQH